MYLKQARQEKKGNNGRIWASPTTQECTQVYVLECTLAPTWKYKNVLVVVVEKNTKSNRILNFDLWISHVKDGQQWSCSVSSGKKLPTATAYDQSYAVRTRHNNHHSGWMLVSEEFKNPCSEQLTWINSRVLGGNGHFARSRTYLQTNTFSELNGNERTPCSWSIVQFTIKGVLGWWAKLHLLPGPHARLAALYAPHT